MYFGAGEWDSVSHVDHKIGGPAARGPSDKEATSGLHNPFTFRPPTSLRNQTKVKPRNNWWQGRDSNPRSPTGA